MSEKTNKKLRKVMAGIDLPEDKKNKIKQEYKKTPSVKKNEYIRMLEVIHQMVLEKK